MTDLERLARRLMEAESWSSFWGLEDATALCRAILKELREPSERMRETGERTLDVVTPQPSVRVSAEAVWQAMIDSILEEYPS